MHFLGVGVVEFALAEFAIETDHFAQLILDFLDIVHADRRHLGLLKLKKEKEKKVGSLQLLVLLANKIATGS